jgi:hypothetical protein
MAKLERVSAQRAIMPLNCTNREGKPPGISSQDSFWGKRSNSEQHTVSTVVAWSVMCTCKEEIWRSIFLNISEDWHCFTTGQ